MSWLALPIYHRPAHETFERRTVSCPTCQIYLSVVENYFNWLLEWLCKFNTEQAKLSPSRRKNFRKMPRGMPHISNVPFRLLKLHQPSCKVTTEQPKELKNDAKSRCRKSTKSTFPWLICHFISLHCLLITSNWYATVDHQNWHCIFEKSIIP